MLFFTVSVFSITQLDQSKLTSLTLVHGFEVLTKAFSSGPAANDVIIDLLLSLLFWRSKGRMSDRRKVKTKTKSKKNKKMKNKIDDKFVNEEIEKVESNREIADMEDNFVSNNDTVVKVDKETEAERIVSELEVKVEVGKPLNPVGFRIAQGAPTTTPSPVHVPATIPSLAFSSLHTHSVSSSMESIPKIHSESYKNENENENEMKISRNLSSTDIRTRSSTIYSADPGPLIPRERCDAFTSPSKSILKDDNDNDVRDLIIGGLQEQGGRKDLRGSNTEKEKEKIKEKEKGHSRGYGYGYERGSSKKLDWKKGDKDGQDVILPLSPLLLPTDHDSDLKSDDAGLTVKRGVSRKRGSILSLFGWSSGAGTGSGTGTGTGAGSAVSVASTNSGLASTSRGSQSHDDESSGGSISPTVASPTLMGMGIGSGMGTVSSYCPPTFPLLPPAHSTHSTNSSSSSFSSSSSYFPSTSSYPSSPSTHPLVAPSHLPPPPTLTEYSSTSEIFPTTPTPSSPPSTRRNQSSVSRFPLTGNIPSSTSPSKEDSLIMKSAVSSSLIDGKISNKVGEGVEVGGSKGENKVNDDEKEEEEGEDEDDEEDEVEVEDEEEEEFYSPGIDSHKDSTPRTEKILVPQILPVLFACLPSVTSLDLVQSTVFALEKAVTTVLPASPSTQRKGFFTESKSVTATPERTHGLFSRTTEVRTYFHTFIYIVVY